MISYSQNFEDVLLERVFRNQSSGFYVDIGANHPDHFSVTKHFYLKGWHGLNIEPGSVFQELRNRRPRDINLHLAISENEGVATFYEYPGEAHGLSGLANHLPDYLRKYEDQKMVYQVDTVPLRKVLESYEVNQIDFMSIDVEGHEPSVLASNDWSRFRPKVLLVESTLPGSPISCHESWEPLVLQANYLFAYFDGLNRFYVRQEDDGLLEHFKVPVSVFDGFVLAELESLREEVHQLRLTQQKEVLPLQRHDPALNDVLLREQHLTLLMYHYFMNRMAIWGTST